MNNGTQYFDIIPYRVATALNLFAQNLTYIDSDTKIKVDLRNLPTDEFVEKVDTFLDSIKMIFNDDSAEQNTIDRSFASKLAADTLLRFPLDLSEFGKVMLYNRYEEFISLGRGDLIENLEQLINRAYSIYESFARGNRAFLDNKINKTTEAFIASGEYTANNTSPLLNLIYKIGRADEVYSSIENSYMLFQTCHDSLNGFVDGLYGKYCMGVAAETANKLFHWLYVSILTNPNSEEMMKSLGVKYDFTDDYEAEKTPEDNLVVPDVVVPAEVVATDDLVIADVAVPAEIVAADDVLDEHVLYSQLNNTEIAL